MNYSKLIRLRKLHKDIAMTKSYIYNISKLFYRKIHRKERISSSFSGRNISSSEEGNRKIKEAIELGTPFLAGRLGSSEVGAMFAIEAYTKGLSKGIVESYLDILKTNAGFFLNPQLSSDSQYKKFLDLYTSAIFKADCFFTFQVPLEDYYIKKYFSGILFEPKGIEPYYFDSPWSAALKGKKVVIVHPFSDTIKRQYDQRSNLFKNKDILPNFDLRVVKAAQTLAGSTTAFESWFDALEWMYYQIISEDFDVAIIGCGAYGLALASMIKSYGKVAIHMGGATQILFGIKGNRWEKIPAVSSMFNEHWLRPSLKEKPDDSHKVEESCYW